LSIYFRLSSPTPPPASPGAEIITPEDMLKETEEFLEDRFSLSSNWISLKHYLNEEQKEAINSLSVAGLGLENEFIRYYPEASLSAHLLGFVGKDIAGQEQGYFGLEGFLIVNLKVVLVRSKQRKMLMEIPFSLASTVFFKVNLGAL